MILPRRDFLKLLGAAGAAGMAGCGPRWSVPDRLVELALRGPGIESEVQTVCGLCEGACGMSVRLVDDLPVGLKGNLHHPLNRGGLCPVGHAALDLLYAPERLTGPLRRRDGGDFEPVGWDEALRQVGARLAEIRESGSGGRLAVLSDEPGDLFHDLARRFVRLFGSPNLSRSRQGDVLPFTLAQGVDEVPGFDLSRSDLVVTFGLDVYEDGATPVHGIAALVGTRETAEICPTIHVGTRLSPSASKAERYVAIRAGTHGAFALGVAHVLVREGRFDAGFVADRTFGFQDWTDETGRPRLGFRRLLMERYYPDRAARFCDCEPAAIVEVARRIGEASAPLALAGGEATRGSNATWTGLAVHALNALTGSFDRPGGVVRPRPIPFTPLPADDGPDPSPDPSVFAVVDRPPLFGVDPVAALAERILDGSRSIDVLFLVSCDPVHDSPAGARFAEALDRIPLVVALTPFRNDTAERADLVLPTPLFLESWQAVTTPPGVAFSVLGAAEPVVEPLHDTRPAGDVLLEAARRAFDDAPSGLSWTDYRSYLEDRLEGLGVSGQGSIVTGSFEEQWRHFLEERGWRFRDDRDPDDFLGELLRNAAWWDGTLSPADWGRTFRTPSGRYEFFSRTLEAELRRLGAIASGADPESEAALSAGIRTLGLEAEGDEACLPHFEPSAEAAEHELVLVPIRTTTGRGSVGIGSRMILEMFGYPVLSGWQTWAELAPETAADLDLADGDLVALESPEATIEAVVKVRPGSSPGIVHVPLGLGRNGAVGASAGIGSNPLELVVPDSDPLSGELAVAGTTVKARLVRRREHGGPAPFHGEESHA